MIFKCPSQTAGRLTAVLTAAASQVEAKLWGRRTVLLSLHLPDQITVLQFVCERARVCVCASNHSCPSLCDCSCPDVKPLCVFIPGQITDMTIVNPPLRTPSVRRRTCWTSAYKRLLSLKRVYCSNRVHFSAAGYL